MASVSHFLGAGRGTVLAACTPGSFGSPAVCGSVDAAENAFTPCDAHPSGMYPNSEQGRGTALRQSPDDMQADGEDATPLRGTPLRTSPLLGTDGDSAMDAPLDFPVDMSRHLPRATIRASAAPTPPAVCSSFGAAAGATPSALVMSSMPVVLASMSPVPPGLNEGVNDTMVMQVTKKPPT